MPDSVNTAVFSRLRILSDTLEQTLEAATAGITAALEAASMGYGAPPAPPPKGAKVTRRRERMRNQKRVVRWVDLEAPSGATGSATGAGEGEGQPPTMQVWKRSRSHESYNDVGERDEADQQHIVFRALVRAHGAFARRVAPIACPRAQRLGVFRRLILVPPPLAPRLPYHARRALARRRTRSARRRRASSQKPCTIVRQTQL